MAAISRSSSISEFRLRLAVQELAQERVIAHPTEAVYGFACDPCSQRAVSQLVQLKQRSLDKGLILLAADFSQLEAFLQPLDSALEQRVKSSWPGPVTWLLPAAADVPAWLTGGRNILAVRVTGHPLSASLCQAFGGPLVSTSANLSGHPAARNRLTVHRHFHERIMIVSGDTGGRSKPSSIIDGLTLQRIR